MKALFIALALVTSSAFAAKVEVAEFSYYAAPSAHSIIGSYGINPSLNRAWVEITLQQSGDSGDNYERALVPGLSIVGDAVVLDIDGQQTECAKVRRTGIFRTLVAKPTKNCKFSVAVKKTPVDDGFEVRIKKSYVLSLETL